MTEEDMQHSALDRMMGFGVVVSAEIPSFGCSVDMVYLHGPLVMAVEFKLHEWRRALRQAYRSNQWADYVYVCRPPFRISPECRETFLKYGVGLSFYRPEGWPFEVVIEGEHELDPWKPARRRIVDFVRQYPGWPTLYAPKEFPDA